MISAVISRDLRLALRRKSDWVIGPVFYLLFLTLCAIALPDIRTDAKLTGALIWLAALFSLLLSFPSIFMADYEDGTLEALLLSGKSKTGLVIAKFIVIFLLVFLPLLVATPLAGAAFGLPSDYTAGILVSLVVSAPALIAYGLFSGALLGRYKSAGFLSILVTAPFLVPVLIFAVSGAENFIQSGLNAVEFKALAGINLIAIAIGFPATIAALGANLE